MPDRGYRVSRNRKYIFSPVEDRELKVVDLDSIAWLAAWNPR
jgi:hypothetical protein